MIFKVAFSSAFRFAHPAAAPRAEDLGMNKFSLTCCHFARFIKESVTFSVATFLSSRNQTFQNYLFLIMINVGNFFCWAYTTSTVVVARASMHTTSPAIILSLEGLASRSFSCDVCVISTRSWDVWFSQHSQAWPTWLTDVSKVLKMPKL